jgi:hypothetical protein
MRLKPDIAVLGAGPAGIAAAVTAARKGAKTLLLERQGFAGGIPVKGYLCTLCGLYLSRAEDRGPQMLYADFPREFATHLMHLDGVKAPVRMGRVYVLPFRPETFGDLAQRLLDSEAALRVCFQTRFCSAEVEEGRIQGLRAVIGGRNCKIESDLVIDASGQALVCQAAGAALPLEHEAQQSPALTFPLSGLRGAGVSISKAARWRMLILRAAEQGILAPEASWVSFLPAVDLDSLLVKLNLGPLMQSQSDLNHQQLQELANKLKHQIVNFLRQNAAEFEDCSTAAVEHPVLHRDGCRGAGEYVLTEQDVLGAEKFPAAAAKGCWPVEKWSRTGEVSVRYLDEGQYYEIPEQALKSSTAKNLFMAGKSISADSGAIASARVIGSCLATGEAAARLALRAVDR